MSTATTPPPSDEVTIEVNGVPMKAKKGAMIIQATDVAGVYVPRFCYHEKLTIAANCRMCLVEVEKAPKPLPACATPVMEGMKVFTKSPKAIAAQKATMEFLLINHPLDCPICDQGGECELQDLAMGFGRDVSRFNERKRVVKDKNIGPLVSTDMTRCIHCTRCVRFGSEIAGIQELGTTGRGEQMRIDTFIERSVDHELSGNIIDLCPVGALNNKPFRYRARGWEMTQHELVSPHDGVGTNLYGHVLRGKLMRIVPRPNEAVNETWIADRDRYSYEGIYAPDRLLEPMVRRNGSWQTVDWETALEVAAGGLKSIVAQHGAQAVGALASPSSTVEELFLLAKALRGLGSGNLDHRLRRRDFRDQDADPLFPGLGMGIDEIEQLDSLLVVGANLRREVPLIAHRVRKAAVRKGAKVSFINPERYDYLFPVLHNIGVSADRMINVLADLMTAVNLKWGGYSPGEDSFPTAQAQAIVESLRSGKRRAILLGALAMRHPAFASLREVAALLAAETGAQLGFLAEGANAAGAALAGVLPHREAGGAPAKIVGKHARAMLESPLRGYLLFGGIEPADLAVEQALESLSRAECVVALTPFADAATRRFAHVILPIGTFAETSGTFVNLAGRWQSFRGAAQPVGASRPGWKVLRVLGNLLNLPGFDQISSEEVREELKAIVANTQPDNSHTAREKLMEEPPRGPLVDIPMYGIDAVVRRAPALQLTREGQRRAVVYPGQSS